MSRWRTSSVPFAPSTGRWSRRVSCRVCSSAAPVAMKDTSIVRIEGLTKRFGAVTAVDGVDLVIERVELFALLGGSGCGKTTLLRLLAGFELPDAGRIVIDSQDMTGV